MERRVSRCSVCCARSAAPRATPSPRRGEPAIPSTSCMRTGGFPPASRSGVRCPRARRRHACSPCTVPTCASPQSVAPARRLMRARARRAPASRTAVSSLARRAARPQVAPTPRCTVAPMPVDTRHFAVSAATDARAASSSSAGSTRRRVSPTCSRRWRTRALRTPRSTWWATAPIVRRSRRKPRARVSPDASAGMAPLPRKRRWFPCTSELRSSPCHRARKDSDSSPSRPSCAARRSSPMRRAGFLDVVLPDAGGTLVPAGDIARAGHRAGRR